MIQLHFDNHKIEYSKLTIAAQCIPFENEGTEICLNQENIIDQTDKATYGAHVRSPLIVRLVEGLPI